MSVELMGCTKYYAVTYKNREYTVITMSNTNIGDTRIEITDPNGNEMSDKLYDKIMRVFEEGIKQVENTR